MNRLPIKGEKVRCLWTGLEYVVKDSFAGAYDLYCDELDIRITKHFCDLKDESRWVTILNPR
jgi:hypothetical protein